MLYYLVTYLIYFQTTLVSQMFLKQYTLTWLMRCASSYAKDISTQTNSDVRLQFSVLVIAEKFF